MGDRWRQEWNEWAVVVFLLLLAITDYSTVEQFDWLLRTSALAKNGILAVIGMYVLSVISWKHSSIRYWEGRKQAF